MNSNNRSPDKTSIIMVISYPDNRLKKEMESLKKNGYDVQVVIWERGWPFPHSPDIKVKSFNINIPQEVLNPCFTSHYGGLSSSLSCLNQTGM